MWIVCLFYSTIICFVFFLKSALRWCTVCRCYSIICCVLTDATNQMIVNRKRCGRFTKYFKLFNHLKTFLAIRWSTAAMRNLLCLHHRSWVLSCGGFVIISALPSSDTTKTVYTTKRQTERQENSEKKMKNYVSSWCNLKGKFCILVNAMNSSWINKYEKT